ncbi:formin-like family protein [Cryptosporidium andersoni]|uniref:Formin-like family protein n=1 Tax=Cryptosporidium andersoni TaxID=117008 RepID=A0A1J4MRR7_9CRYT|nr:formin-like family protein [Cryptosporidium andersoni]
MDSEPDKDLFLNLENKTDEELLSSLLKMVEIDSDNGKLIELMKSDPEKLNRIKEILKKQHPNLIKLSDNTTSKDTTRLQPYEDKKKESSPIPSKRFIGQPPGPPPLKSALINGCQISSNNISIRGCPPKKGPPPPKLKMISKNKSLSMKNNLGKVEYLECSRDNTFDCESNLFVNIDFGPTPPIGYEPRRLHWSVITMNKIKGTFWEDIHNEKVNLKQETSDDLNLDPNIHNFTVDFQKILELFFEDRRIVSDKIAYDGSFTNNNSIYKKYRTVLDSKRSQNVEIALKAMQLIDNNNEFDMNPIKEMLGYKSESLLYGIDKFLNGVSKEKLKILLDLYPTADEIQLLKEFSADSSNASNLPWRISEQFMLNILSLNRFKTRAHCVLSMKTFEEEYLSCVERLIKLEDAVDYVHNNLCRGGILRNILYMILKIGNYLNHGTNRGQTVGFRFHSLDLIKNIKSTKSKLTLLKYISKVIYDHSIEIRNKIDKLSHICSEAASVDIEDVLKDIDELANNINIIKKELELNNTVERSQESNYRDLCNKNSGDTNDKGLKLSEFEVDYKVDTVDLYVKMVETFVMNSSCQLEIIRKQLMTIVEKLRNLQNYAGESQAKSALVSSSKLGVHSGIEIIKICDGFLRLIKEEFIEFHNIEKKKKDRELRNSISVRPCKVKENNSKTSKLSNTINNSVVNYNSNSEVNSEVNKDTTIVNQHHQLLLDVSDVMLTSNSSTISSSSSSSSLFNPKAASYQTSPHTSVIQTPVHKSRNNTSVIESNTDSKFGDSSLHSGYDQLNSSGNRINTNFSQISPSSHSNSNSPNPIHITSLFGVNSIISNITSQIYDPNKNKQSNFPRQRDRRKV